jgi:integrase
MTKMRIPGMATRPNKDGGNRYYWKPSATLIAAGWKMLSLGKDEGKAIAAAIARNAEVEAWKNGDARIEQTEKIKPRVSKGTVGDLVARYRREYVYGTKPTGGPRVAPRTAEGYETGLKRIEEWAGNKPVGSVTPLAVAKLRDVSLASIRHAPALNLLRTLRQLFAFAESIEVIPKGSNPARKFDLPGLPPRSNVWEEADEAAFMAAANDLNMPSLALAIELALYSGQREGDLIAFTEPQLQRIFMHDAEVEAYFAGPDGTVKGWVMKQTKTSTEYSKTGMEIALEPWLLAKVEAAIRNNRARDRAADPARLLTYVLVNDSTGMPYKKRNFISHWQKVIEHAVTATGREQMRDLVWHDLRRTLVVRCRRQGMAKEMIASITGHSLQSIEMMLKVYGPVDPTITAAALKIRKSSQPPAAPPTPGKKESA